MTLERRLRQLEQTSRAAGERPEAIAEALMRYSLAKHIPLEDRTPEQAAIVAAGCPQAPPWFQPTGDLLISAMLRLEDQGWGPHRTPPAGASRPHA